jgi:lactoylglutathione lyase
MPKMIHSMIRVRDEDASVAFYRDAFGLEVANRYPFEGFTLLYLRDAEGTFELELTINPDREERYALGDGYGHLAVLVDDLEGAHNRAAECGMEPTPIRALVHDGQPFARFFFLTDPDGYRIEVLERAGRFE